MTTSADRVRIRIRSLRAIEVMYTAMVGAIFTKDEVDALIAELKTHVVGPTQEEK